MRYTGATLTYPLWLRFSGRYVAAVFAAHLIWEILQLPLYTIWWEDSMGEIAFAVAHCTAGDVLIGATALAIGILLFGRGHGPDKPKVHARVSTTAVVLGIGYTAFSEWYNTRGGGWAYGALMPLVPPLDIGLSPLLQWFAVPGIALWWLRPRPASRRVQPPSTSSSEMR